MDAAKTRWEIPAEEPFPYDKPDKYISKDTKGLLYSVLYIFSLF